MSSSPESSFRGGCPVFWFSGLSGAGKTTVADSVSADLTAQGHIIAIFDGDEVRRRRPRPLGYSRADVLLNNAEIAALCLAEQDRADAIFVPIISPYAEGRGHARDVIGDRFFEVYFSAHKECVAARDSKGLYAKAARGESPAMIGSAPTAPYEPPADPDLVLDSAAESVEESAEKLTRFVLEKI